MQRPGFGAPALTWLPGLDLMVTDDDKQCHSSSELYPTCSASDLSTYLQRASVDRLKGRGVYSGLASASQQALEEQLRQAGMGREGKPGTMIRIATRPE